MTGRIEGPYNTDNDRDSKTHYERVGGEHKDSPRGTNSSEIDDSEKNKNYQAERERIREEKRDRGDERAHPGGDRNGNVKHIVN